MLKRHHEEAKEIMESVRLRNQENVKKDFLPPKVKGFRLIKTIKHPMFGNTAFLMQYKGNLFTFFRTSFLKANGTLDGVNFDSQFGRRKWNDKPLGYEYIPKKYIDSVTQNGGFLVSTYLLSEDLNTGFFVSKKRKIPATNLMYHEIAAPCKSFAINESGFDSELQYGACYDTIGEWLIETGSITMEEWCKNSTSLGNYYNSNKSYREVCPNGYRKEWMLGGVIDNLAGNVSELTQEQNGATRRIIRGGCFLNNGNSTGSEASSRNDMPISMLSSTTAGRLVIFLK